MNEQMMLAVISESERMRVDARWAELMSGWVGIAVIGLVVIWVILWTLLPFFVMRISDRIKRMERIKVDQMNELRTQTGLLRALVATLQGAEVERK
jgi:hypothetical protein